MPSPQIDFSRQETFLDGVLTIWRGAMSPSIAHDVAESALNFLEIEGWDFEPTERGFRASNIVPIDESVPSLQGIAAQVLRKPLDKGTLRVNYQDGGGKQGWHTDYVVEPLIAYPIGVGFLDFAPDAETIEEVRAPKHSSDIVSIPIRAGDIGVVHLAEKFSIEAETPQKPILDLVSFYIRVRQALLF